MGAKFEGRVVNDLCLFRHQLRSQVVQGRGRNHLDMTVYPLFTPVTRFIHTGPLWSCTCTCCTCTCHQRRPLAASRPRDDPDPPPTQSRAAGSRPRVTHSTKRPLHARAARTGRGGRAFGALLARSCERCWRAAARPQTAAAASAVAPTVRLIDPRLPVERSASVVAPESLATAGLSSSEGGNRAERARVQALGGRHTPSQTRQRSPCHRPSGRWQGGGRPRRKYHVLGCCRGAAAAEK